jgi:hypothetical protein
MNNRRKERILEKLSADARIKSEIRQGNIKVPTKKDPKGRVYPQANYGPAPDRTHTYGERRKPGSQGAVRRADGTLRFGRTAKTDRFLAGRQMGQNIGKERQAAKAGGLRGWLAGRRAKALQAAARKLTLRV